MAASAYETLSAFKAMLGIPSANTEKDDTLQQLLSAATEAIDLYCARTFNVSAPYTRQFDAPYDSDLQVLDLLTVSAITLNGVALATTAYSLRPFTLNSRYPHYTVVRRMQQLYPGPWAYADPWTYRSLYVAITGTWGYASSVPVTIKQVCRIIAARLYRRELNMYGNEGGTTAEGASIVQSPKASIDADCAALLAPYTLKFKAGTLSATDPRPYYGEGGWR